MEDKDSLTVAVQKTFSASNALRELTVRDVIPLAGDASLRSYYRVRLKDSNKVPSSTLIYLSYGNARGPAFPQVALPSQEEALVQLSQTFAAVSLPVPQLLFHDKTAHALVFEDCGDRSLAQLVSGAREALVDQLYDRYGAQWVERLFEYAIELIVKIQQLTPAQAPLIYMRWLDFENYRREALEFIEYVAEPRGVTKGGREVLLRQIDALCETILSFPKRPSHFDYHAHNILVRDDGSLVLLDYQDACLMSPARDIVSLLNDRGMDEKLGKATQSRLLQYFMRRFHDRDKFAHFYNMTLLHWDLRVSGRFHKLGREKNTSRYQQWIPGTLRRIGRTLVRSHKEIHGMSDLLEVISKLCPEAREGVEDPWSLPDAAD